MAGKPDSIASKTPSSTWKGWLWDSADVSKEERRFLLKVGHLTISNYRAQMLTQISM
jgi:ACS family pantothenate transporter-like MFS transporter